MKTYLRHVTTILLHILGVILVLILLLPKAVEGMVNLFKKYHQEPFRIIRFDEEKKRGYIGTFLIVNWLGMSKTAQNNRVFTYFLFPSLSAFSLFVALPLFH